MLDKAADPDHREPNLRRADNRRDGQRSHTVTQRDIDLFSTVTGDVNPAHVDPAYAETDMFHHIIIQGMWGGGTDLRRPRHQVAGSGHDLSWPGSAFPPPGDHRRHDHRDGDGAGEKARKRRRDARLRLHQPEGRGGDHRERLYARADREGPRPAGDACPMCEVRAPRRHARPSLRRSGRRRARSRRRWCIRSMPPRCWPPSTRRRRG